MNNSNAQVLFVKGTDTNDYKVAKGYHVFCGNCNRAAYQHPVIEENFECNREADEIPYLSPESTDYWGCYDSNGNPVPMEYIQDFAGPDSERSDPHEYEDYVAECDAVESWKDNDPDLEAMPDVSSWWTQDRNGNSTGGTYAPDDKARRQSVTLEEPARRNAYVEGFDGFMAMQVLDFDKTEAFQMRKVLNAYRDNRGDYRIGGLKLARANGYYKATCTHRDCSVKDANGNWTQAGAQIETATATRAEMEAFTMTLIRHGNNHAAMWFRKRDTFYKLHGNECDLNCPPGSSESACNHNNPSVLVVTEENLPVFLQEHMRHCRVESCLCGEALAEVTPDAGKHRKSLVASNMKSRLSPDEYLKVRVLLNANRNGRKVCFA